MDRLEPMRRGAGGSLVLGLAAVALALPGAASGAVIEPNITTDELDSPTPNSTCSLREAVESASSGTAVGGCPAGDSGSDTIRLQPMDTYTLSLPGIDDNNAGGDLDLYSDISIEVAGGGGTTIQGSPPDGWLIHAFSPTPQTIAVSLSGLSLVPGGGSRAMLVGTLMDTSTTPVVSIGNTTISGITAGKGAGIFQASGTINLTNSTISGNETTGVDGDGGAIFAEGGELNISNATIVDNHAGGGGGDGGGIANAGGGIRIKNSIIAMNTDDGPFFAPDCYGGFFSDGYNLVGDATECLFVPALGDFMPLGPLNLGTLADNGGPNRTHALLPGSPAIDAGNPAAPGSGGGACVLEDQRHLIRGAVSGRCDVGAYERGAQPPPTAPGSTTPSAPVSVAASPPSTAPVVKRCKKGQRLKKGRCVKKKRKK